MANNLDYLAIVSNGVFPEPTPTDQIRMMLAVSQGLLNIAISPPDVGEDQSGGLNDVGTSTRL